MKGFAAIDNVLSIVVYDKAVKLTEQIFVAELANGLTLLAQPMDQVSSAAMTILTPAGASRAPDQAPGAAAVGSEWLMRGAGELDTRGLNDALDRLGCRHHETARSEHIGLSAVQLGRNLPEVMRIYADILRRPRLEDETFEPCRALVRQELASIQDEPARKCTMLLREKFYPYPLGRCVYGDEQSLRQMPPQAVREHVTAGVNPSGTIIAVAGEVDWDGFRRLADDLLGSWQGRPVPAPPTREPTGGVTHVKKDSAQTHIGLAHRSVTLDSDSYYPARVAETILSAGMASRLFTEVREKRGLVYHVSSSYHSLKSCAAMLTYAGTTPQNAQQTFEVTVGELRRLAEGLTADELDRAKTQLKSALIMQGESTESRAAAMAGDWYHLRRVRSLDEIAEAIDRVAGEDILAYLAEYPAENFTVVTIGPEPIDTNAVNT